MQGDVLTRCCLALYIHFHHGHVHTPINCAKESICGTLCNYPVPNRTTEPQRVDRCHHLLSPSHGISTLLLTLRLTDNQPFICTSSVQLDGRWNHFGHTRRTFGPRKDTDVRVPDEIDYNHRPRGMRRDGVIKLGREGSQLW